MRLSKTEVEKREAFVVELFKQEPDLSVPKANAKVKEKFGNTMRASRLYELRTKAAEKPVETAARTSNGAQAVEAAPKKRRGRPKKTKTTEAESAPKKRGRPKGKKAVKKTVKQPVGSVAFRMKNGPSILSLASREEGEGLGAALKKLHDAGLTTLRIEHLADNYAVIGQG